MNCKRIGLSSVVLLLAACVHQQPAPAPAPTPAPIVIEKPIVKDTACDWDFPIVVTDGFITLLKQYPTELNPVATQILKHNKTGEAKCNWTPIVKKDK